MHPPVKVYQWSLRVSNAILRIGIHSQCSENDGVYIGLYNGHVILTDKSYNIKKSCTVCVSVVDLTPKFCLNNRQSVFNKFFILISMVKQTQILTAHIYHYIVHAVNVMSIRYSRSLSWFILELQIAEFSILCYLSEHLKTKLSNVKCYSHSVQCLYLVSVVDLRGEGVGGPAPYFVCGPPYLS